jgi:O-antigen/teichoic acid export membrane protein
LSAVGGQAVRRGAAVLRANALMRSSALLIADYLVIGAVGAMCSVIAARSWSPHDIGAVAGIAGAAALIITASTTGIASTITRFLAGEHAQRQLVLEALAFSIVVVLALDAAICFTPGHFGVPLHNLRVSNPVAFLLIGAYVVSSVVVAVSDPAFLSRKEVSYSVFKDISSSAVRVGILFALIGTGVVGLYGASIGYVTVAAALDLGLVFWRLRNGRPGFRLFRFQMLRRRIRFAAGSHAAALMSALPSAVTITIIAAHLGPTTAAYVAVPVGVSTYITIIPFMTAQALLAELSGETVDVAQTGLRALRMAYAATLPLATVTVLLAHPVMSIYGHRYSVHGATLLRWAAAATVFSTFNYIGDTVLLARHKLLAYNIVNAIGTVAILALVLAAVTVGAPWIGPAMFTSQVIYAAASASAMLRYGSIGEAWRTARGLSWRF